MRVIGLTQLRDAVLRAIEEKGGDYVYPSAGGNCVYFEGDEHTNSCGIGYALDTLELKSKAIDLIDEYRKNQGGMYFPRPPEPSAEELLRMFNDDDDDVMFTAAAKHWAQEFQLRQDDGATWQGAADHADNRAGTAEYIGINQGREPVTVAAVSHSDLFGDMHSASEHDPNL